MNEPREEGTREEFLTIINRKTRKYVIIWWDNEWEEYVCRSYFIGGKVNVPVTDEEGYHTSDKHDALGTALSMIGANINIFNMEDE